MSRIVGQCFLRNRKFEIQGFRVAVAARIQVLLGAARGVFDLGRCPSFGQIVTSAFGEKHTPDGVLFIANDYLMFPVIYMEKGSDGRPLVAARFRIIAWSRS